MVQVKKIFLDKAVDETDEVAVEEPLEIQLVFGNSAGKIKKSISVTMRTPGNDEELTAGFLFTEGIVQSIDQISEIKPDRFDNNKIIVALADDFNPDLQKAERNFYTTSSCGVCGKSSIEAVKIKLNFNSNSDDIAIYHNLFFKLSNELKEHQKIFGSTGGLHASVLFDPEGKLLILREDVGRHNALDKVIGCAFLNNELPLNKNILWLSGRSSFELIQKALMGGIKIVAAVGAPSSLAVSLANEHGITLLGFLRGERFNIYSGADRILM